MARKSTWCPLCCILLVGRHLLVAIDAGSPLDGRGDCILSRAVELSGRRARSAVEKPEGYKYKARGRVGETEVERQCPRHNACRTNPIFRDTHLSLYSGQREKARGRNESGETESVYVREKEREREKERVKNTKK